MPDQTMIERVARTLYLIRHGSPGDPHADAPDPVWGQRWKEYEPEARAVFTAMREPTEVMAAAIATVIHREADDAGPEHDFRPAEFIDDAVEAWRAAIDAALEDGR